MADQEMLQPWKNQTSAIRYFGFFFILVLLLPLISPVSAKVITYDGKTNASSLQNLINSTTTGDSIFLAGGKYFEAILIDRPIVFGALDTNDSPEIVSKGSHPGITLAADGITLNGITISGSAEYGLLVQSSNNRISAVTTTGFDRGIGLKSAKNNILSGNILVNNSIGIDVDRNSHSNIFYLNYLDNTRDVAIQANDNIWFSNRQDYRYAGRDLAGPVGNYWKANNATDSNDDGIGDDPYVIQSAVSGTPQAMDILDRAPLISPPDSYTLVRVTSPMNTTLSDGLFNPPEFSSSQFSQNQPDVNPYNSQMMNNGPFPNSSANFPGPLNPSLIFLVQFWWVVPIAFVISAVAGIWFERRWMRRDSVPRGEETPGLLTRYVTRVKKSGPGAGAEVSGHLHYAAHLPAALEKKYPGAEYVAEGGVSRVFRARDEKEGRDVAVKIPIRFDEVSGTQFTKELHVWEGLHHKNIVEIYAANIFPVPYIEMEYVESSLASLQFPLEMNRATAIITGVAQGLRYAHEQGIVHRDLKPENIMVTADDTPKISDWGLSKAEGTKQSGIIGFSLEYAAPEQLAPNIYGEPGSWTDIYQLGVLFYEMLTGHVPFKGGGMGEITHAILHDDISPLTLSGPGSAEIRDIILKCLQKRPQDRYSSVAEVLKDLEKIRN